MASRQLVRSSGIAMELANVVGVSQRLRTAWHGVLQSAPLCGAPAAPVDRNLEPSSSASLPGIQDAARAGDLAADVPLPEAPQLMVWPASDVDARAAFSQWSLEVEERRTSWSRARNANSLQKSNARGLSALARAGLSPARPGGPAPLVALLARCGTHPNHSFLSEKRWIKPWPRASLLARAPAPQWLRRTSEGTALEVGPTRHAHAEAAQESPAAGTGAPLVELKLAQTGEGIAECELLKWFVQEGDEVKQFELVCQVQSDKATVDITSRYTGRIVRTHFVPGDVVKVGETLADIIEASGATSAAQAPSPTAGPQAFGGEDEAAAHQGGAQGKTEPGVLATPAVRHLARSYGLNLAEIPGTGPAGRVLKQDVVKIVAMRQGVEEEARVEQEALEGPEADQGTPVHGSPAAEASAPDTAEAAGPKAVAAQEAWHVGAAAPVPGSCSDAGPTDLEIPIRGYRRAMVKAMAAATSIPHFNFMDEFDVSALAHLVARINASMAAPAQDPAAPNTKLTTLSFLVKALSLALFKYPSLNATVDADVNTIRCSSSHNVGIAMATPHGLVVPNVKNCERRSVHEISVEIYRLRQLAAANQLSQADLAGGTITVSNIGAVGGGTYACPLVFQPQLAIVALGRVRRQPRFDTQGNVCAASIMNVSWAADHRVVDGATLACLSLEWQRLVEQPELLLLALR